MVKYLLLAALSIAVSVTAASADFRAVRSIPLPDGPGSIQGLDTDGEVLFAVAHQGDCTSMCSYLYLLDPADGTVLREDYSFNYPPDCGDMASLLISCACPGGDLYWVGDQCGDVVKIFWTEDSLNIRESFNLGGGDMGYWVPEGLTCRYPLIYTLDSFYRRIVVYDEVEDYIVSQVGLPGEITYPSSITLYGDDYLVSSAATDSVFELNGAGELVGVHWLDGFGERTAVGITMLDGLLYVASSYDSIIVFERTSYEEPVPEGDNVAVEIVPDGVTVNFDSVSTGGTMTAAVTPTDSCPPPEGVWFFDVFTEVSTNANFDYAAEVVISTRQALPSGVDPDLVRVFVRPSGACQDYRDITTKYTELPSLATRLLSSLSRTISEDYEFSVLALAVDTRAPRAVVELKFDNLEGSIDAGASSIPPAVLSTVNGLLDRGRDTYYRGLSGDAAVLVDSIATLVRATSAIPHTYDPDTPGANLAGHLISDAHTLAFSLRFSADSALPTEARMAPECVDFSHDGWVRATIEVPPGHVPEEVDPEHVFFMHRAQAVPESVAVGDYDGDGAREVRAMFRKSQVRTALSGYAEGPKRITCFMSGYQVHADAWVYMLGAGQGLMGEGPYLAGRAGSVGAGLSIVPNPAASSVSIGFSPRGDGPVSVGIYSVRGELVKTLESRGRASGAVSMTWEGDNQQGAKVAPGTYFVVVREASTINVRKVVLEP
jgi:hypothetical protein